jgi:DNA-directed RNA polymerase subunit RPC12/RpoP
MTILFLHGWQSNPGGVKPTFLRNHGHTVLNPALPDDDFAAAVRIAQAEFDRFHPDVVVGSSRGGAVAMSINAGTTPLVLLCPAWKRWGGVTKVKPRTVILHSRADDVVPFSDSLELVRNSGLPPDALIVVGNDHRLVDPEPLGMMLKAVERVRTRQYDCADCGCRFPVSISEEEEMRTSLRTNRPEQCPRCGQKVGVGNVTCRKCGAIFPVGMPHWHVHCNVAGGTCPKCGDEYVSLCICSD